MLILVNPSASHGRAHRRWMAVHQELIRRGIDFTARVTRRAISPEDIDRFCHQGHKVLIAAGGDGTVNGLINSLMDAKTDRPRHPCVVGAVGLGSSNDFHKPKSPERRVAGIPARIDANRAHDVDLGKVTIWGPKNVEPPSETLTTAGSNHESLESVRIRYFAINASFGVTALGNHLFNNPKGLLAWAKPRSYNLASTLTIIEAIIRFRRIPLTIRIDAPEPFEGTFEVNNLGILKNVHFTGALRYDTPVLPDDGFFDVNLYCGHSLPGMMRSLSNVARGRFLGTLGSHHWRATRLTVTAREPVPLEVDGEVFLTNKARFEVIPRCIRLCG